MKHTHRHGGPHAHSIAGPASKLHPGNMFAICVARAIPLCNRPSYTASSKQNTESKKTRVYKPLQPTTAPPRMARRVLLLLQICCYKSDSVDSTPHSSLQSPQHTTVTHNRKIQIQFFEVATGVETTQWGLRSQNHVPAQPWKNCSYIPLRRLIHAWEASFQRQRCDRSEVSAATK